MPPHRLCERNDEVAWIGETDEVASLVLLNKTTVYQSTSPRYMATGSTKLV